MKKYPVQIKETLIKIITVEANGAAEALISVTNAYKRGDHVLDYSDFAEVEIKMKPPGRNRGIER